MKNELMTKASQLLASAQYQLKKHSPEILMAAGIAGTIVGTVLACKATTKVNEILEEKNKMVDDVHTCLEDETYKDKYTEEDGKKDLTVIYAQTGVKLIKLYAPAVGVMALSFASIIAGHKILKKRNIAIAAAYTAIDQGFKKYRENVIAEYGEGVDQAMRFGLKSREIKKKDENGKTVKEKEYYIDDENPNSHISEYARFFDAASVNFEKDPEYNMMFLRRQQDFANEMLKSRGHLFLNEVYDLLDIPRSKAGQVVGWIYNKDGNTQGDNYIDFGLYRNEMGTRRFVNGLEYNILLDFNVDGIIYDLI
jgi:hypothetical protein